MERSTPVELAVAIGYLSFLGVLGGTLGLTGFVMITAAAVHAWFLLGKDSLSFQFASGITLVALPLYLAIFAWSPVDTSWQSQAVAAVMAIIPYSTWRARSRSIEVPEPDQPLPRWMSILDLMVLGAALTIYGYVFVTILWFCGFNAYVIAGGIATLAPLRHITSRQPLKVLYVILSCVALFFLTVFALMVSDSNAAGYILAPPTLVAGYAVLRIEIMGRMRQRRLPHVNPTLRIG